MVIAVAAIVAAVVFVLAAVVVGREARRLDAMPARATIDIDEQVLFVADRLPDDVTSQLSYGDVRQILDWQLDYMSAHGLEVTGGDPEVVDEPVVVNTVSSLDYVTGRAAAAGVPYTAPQIESVLDAQLAYLDEIGAVGPAAEEDENVRAVGPENAGNSPS